VIIVTDNHSYNTPAKGARDWHVPLNDNFERLDADVEIRDRASNRSDYVAKAGAKFLATDTGAAYIGDGSNWNRLATTGETPVFERASVASAPSSSTDVARKREVDAKADATHSHTGDDLTPDSVDATTVKADRVEATTVVASDAGTVVWNAYEQAMASGTRTRVEFQSVERDQRNQWDGSNYELTLAEAGNYMISAGIFWLDDPSSGTNHWFTVRRNDNVGVLQQFAEGSVLQLQATRPVLAADAGDTIHMEVEQYEGSELRLGGSRVSTYLSVVQL
jgi:hypothetical protein